MVNTYNKVGNKAIITTTTMARYFPQTICHGVKGRVFNVSKVPVLNSSEKLLIERAGIRKINTHGERSKKAKRVAYPKSKTLLSFNTNRYNALTTKKRIMVI